MRLLAAAFLAASLASVPASAANIMLNLDDGAQKAAAQLPSMVDNCVSALMLRNDPAICRTISMWVAALDNEVKKAQVVAAKKAADDAAVASKAAEAAAIAKKAAEDDAAKKAAEPSAPVDKSEPAAPE
jgi:hypothetical protein